MVNSKIKMSNKKDHKIDITDVAINKVGKIEFEEIPKEEHLIISNLAKMVLEISKENNNSNEVSITYKMGTDIRDLESSIGVQFGNEYEVDPLGNTTSYHIIKGQNECIVILLHNHPSLSSFSLDDIYFFLSYHTIKMMVLVSNKGDIHYMVKNDKYDIDKNMLLLNKAGNEYNKSKSLKKKFEAINIFLKKCKKNGIIYKKQ